jgi:hypothetical protein
MDEQRGRDRRTERSRLTSGTGNISDKDMDK